MQTDTVSARIRESGLLYPMILIAAIALSVFSAVSLATVMGWMPGALAVGDPRPPAVVSHSAEGDSPSVVLITDRGIVADD